MNHRSDLCLKEQTIEKILEQECIPVGCVPATRWPYARVCFWGGVCSGGAGVCSRGCLLRGGVCSGGVCSRGGGGWCGIPACTEADTPPLLTESQTPVKTLPWPNFVAAGKNGKVKDREFCQAGKWNHVSIFYFNCLFQSIALSRGYSYW